MSKLYYCTQLPDGDYWFGEYERFQELVDQKVLWNQQGKKLNHLDSSDRAILESWLEIDDITGTIAKNLLSVNFGDEFYLDPIELGSGGKRAGIASFNQDKAFNAQVYPNPAESYVSFTFNGSLGKDIVLSLMDANGSEVKRADIKAKTPVKIITTESLSPGQYYYRAVSGEQVITGKLSIVK